MQIINWFKKLPDNHQVKIIIISGYVFIGIVGYIIFYLIAKFKGLC
jgi:hypothetical protein